MIAVFKRELKSYFLTPVGYVFIGVFTGIGGIMFYTINIKGLSSDILLFLGQMTFLWMLLTPVLTMRLIAEERQKKTDQLLLTSPVSQTGIILGKYAAAVAALLSAVVLLNGYIALILWYGRVYFFEWLIGMLGFFLQGCAFIALDLYISGLSNNQVTACVGAFGANLLVWVADQLALNINVRAVSGVLGFLSLFKRYEPFLLGQLSWASITFYAAFTLFFLAASVRGLEAARTKGARR